MSDPLATPAVLATLDDLVHGLKAGTDEITDTEQIAKDDDRFYENSLAFSRAYRAELEARGLDWPPLPALVVLEQEFVDRAEAGDLDDDQARDYFAAIRTVRRFATLPGPAGRA